MEIEFNPGQYAKLGTSQPAARRLPVGPAKTAERFDRAPATETAANHSPAVRPEKVERARVFIADTKYPPDELVERIANLLAMHLTIQ